eukprot:scaffold8075_cov115-Isochrysis_galbana.AAC.7
MVRGCERRVAHLARSAPVRTASMGASTGRSPLENITMAGPRLCGDILKRSSVVLPDGRVALQSSSAVPSPLGRDDSASYRTGDADRPHSISQGLPEKNTSLSASAFVGLRLPILVEKKK